MATREELEFVLLRGTSARRGNRCFRQIRQRRPANNQFENKSQQFRSSPITIAGK
jgi:hypothetical protein